MPTPILNEPTPAEQHLTPEQQAVFDEHWALWEPSMRADLPEASDTYLKNVLRAYLFANRAFEAHVAKMPELVAAKPKLPPSVDLDDIKCLTKDEHAAHMEATLSPRSWELYKEATREPTEEEIEAARKEHLERLAQEQEEWRNLRRVRKDDARQAAGADWVEEDWDSDAESQQAEEADELAAQAAMDEEMAAYAATEAKLAADRRKARKDRARADEGADWVEENWDSDIECAQSTEDDGEEPEHFFAPGVGTRAQWVIQECEEDEDDTKAVPSA
jgi:hypothetical protein